MPLFAHVWPATVPTAWILLPLDQLASLQSWWPWQSFSVHALSEQQGMWQLGPWRQSVSTFNTFPLGLVFLLVGSAGSSSKPMHVCVPQVHPSQSALYKAPSLNLHPSKSVASFWSCSIVPMHCHWFFFLLKSNHAFPEYSHQLCLLFLYYMLHYTITIIL